MITQDAARRPEAAAAPVPYSEVRTAARLSRAALGTALLALAAVGHASGIPGAPLKALAGALVVIHAILDFPGRHALPALAIDAVLLCGAAGAADQVHGPLVAVLAYLLAAAILLVPRRHLPFALAGLGAGTGVRLLVIPPAAAEAENAAVTLAAIESGFFLTALGLLVLGAGLTVSQGRRRQARALEAEQRAAAMKNEFVSMVSHELRTPLTNIAGFSMALRESWRRFDPAEVDEFLEVVCREAEHLRALVDDVLVVPRLEAGRLPVEPVDFSLGPAAFRIATLVFPPGGEKSISVSVGGGAVVRADPNRVEQVLRNLLENAARHGGRQVNLEATYLAGEWQVTVSDDGPGIDPADRERVFAPFEQAGAGGSPGQGLGLGLTVSRVLVEAMGGRIWYEPGFPTGARFSFTLPAASSRQGAPLPVAP